MNETPIYQSQDFRTYPQETVRQNGEWVTYQVCEELDPESGRWEPFVTVISRVPVHDVPVYATGSCMAILQAMTGQPRELTA